MILSQPLGWFECTFVRSLVGLAALVAHVNEIIHQFTHQLPYCTACVTLSATYRTSVTATEQIQTRQQSCRLSNVAVQQSVGLCRSHSGSGCLHMQCVGRRCCVLNVSSAPLDFLCMMLAVSKAWPAAGRTLLLTGCLCSSLAVEARADIAAYADNWTTVVDLAAGGVADEGTVHRHKNKFLSSEGKTL